MSRETNVSLSHKISELRVSVRLYDEQIGIPRNGLGIHRASFIAASGIITRTFETCFVT